MSTRKGKAPTPRAHIFAAVDSTRRLSAIYQPPLEAVEWHDRLDGAGKTGIRFASGPDVGFVYFARLASGEGPIKIGCTLDLADRLRGLNAQNPYPLAYIATEFGGKRREKVLHLKFAHLRTHWEWFEPADELIDYVAHASFACWPVEAWA